MINVRKYLNARTEPASELISCSNLIEETREFSRVLIRKKVTQRWQIAKHIYTHGNAGQIQQILLNLLKNACDATRNVESPEISVRLCAIEADAKLAERSGLTEGLRYALLTVADNGCGIPDEIRESIFDPFFTTKDIGEGTGMGLAMVYGAMQNHLGWIDVASEPGKGAVFSLYFPLASEPAEQSTDDAPDKPLLLLVDDEPMMLEVGAEILEMMGFQVITADNGEDALNLFRDRTEHIRAVVLDVMMPRQSGTETAGKMRALRADLPILFSTGYDQHAISGELLADSHTAMLHKPWKAEELEQTLQRIMA